VTSARVEADVRRIELGDQQVADGLGQERAWQDVHDLPAEALADLNSIHPHLQ
jgi:hypothetical protein